MGKCLVNILRYVFYIILFHALTTVYIKTSWHPRYESKDWKFGPRRNTALFTAKRRYFNVVYSYAKNLINQQNKIEKVGKFTNILITDHSLLHDILQKW